HAEQHRQCGIVHCKIRANPAQTPRSAAIARRSWLPDAGNRPATASRAPKLTTSQPCGGSRSRSASILLNGQPKGFCAPKATALNLIARETYEMNPVALLTPTYGR